MPPISNSQTKASLFKPPTSKAPGDILQWTGLKGCGDSLALASAISQNKNPFVVITTDTQSALRVEHELRFYLRKEFPVSYLPDWETLPYDVFSPLPEITSQRLKTLSTLPTISRGAVVLSISTALHKIAPREHILSKSFNWSIGQNLPLDGIRRQLEKVGYQCVSQVYQHGEFAIRGSILDLFPMGSTTPFRIELFDEEIESIRTFDTETQRSQKKYDNVNLFPAREFPIDEDSIKRFRKNFRSIFPDISQRNTIYQDVSKGIAPGGIEYYLPMFVESTNTIFDYIPHNTSLIYLGEIDKAASNFFSDTYNRYEQRRHDIERPLLVPEELFLSPALLEEHQKTCPLIQILVEESLSNLSNDQISFSTQPIPDISLKPRQAKGAEALDIFLHQFEGRILFIAESAGHRENLLATLNKHEIRPEVVSNWVDFLAGDMVRALVVAPMDHGLLMDDPKIAITTESQLTGQRAQQRRRRRRTSGRELENIVSTLSELSIGTPVVHQDHGIGRYQGLQKLEVGGIETEFLILEYAKNDKLYVPVASLHCISRYTGASAETAPLHKLGGDQWNKAKKRAAARVRDVAAELLDINSRRAAKQGFAHRINNEEYENFALAFPFEETPDQDTAIKQTLKDMASPQPMDRVICGDVGFGKTEVCMRAAFIAIQSDKQVAVLVPTTLLAHQHHQNFCDRFADWPIRVKALSRFVSKKQQESILAETKSGKIDILIGTHKLLQNTVEYQNLGLVIIDEEHRFGVRHKEHFKKLRSELDILTLTATPIPRTLNMAMSGLRDISIIATPPPNRHAIKTFITEPIDALIQEACLREIRRGGQIFYLHNNVKSIERAARELEQLVPEARIEIAHGQMPERQLEKVMLDFYHQRFNMLVCTTIIESGIDIPSANTILINRADKLGLAQLHQLRGRVGRSHHRAYAYLIIPPKPLMTSDAVKRLSAIEESDSLGAGFMLSSHDLEIRGAGELLGDEQSGQIQEIGFTLYTELLERAVSALKSGTEPDLESPLDTGPEVDFYSTALIPDDYLPDVHTRLVLYKRIANSINVEELWQLKVEMIDRFGLFPDATKNLFAITEIKIQASEMEIRKIEVGPSNGRILFGPEPKINTENLLDLIQKQPEQYKLDGPEKLKFFKESNSAEEKLEFVGQLLELLKNDCDTAMAF